MSIMSMHFEVSLKSVQGTNQRNDSFRFTAGINFSVPGTSVTFTLIKSPSSWNSRDMDFILENGDAI